MPTTAQEFWVYVGEHRVTITGEPKPMQVATWFALDAKGKITGKELYFDKTKGAAVGSVYEVKATRADGGGVSMVRGSWVREFEDRKLVAEWTAITDAARVAARIAAAERKAKDTALVYEEILAPFRRAWLNSDPLGRQVILVKVMRFISAGVKS